MADETTYYDMLSVEETATAADIKTAYRSRVKEYHPDKFQNQPAWVVKEATERFKLLQEAYEVLAAPERRLQYDTGLRRMRQAPPPSPSSNPPPRSGDARADASGSGPVLAVAEEHLAFQGLRPGSQGSGSIQITNRGGGVLRGAVRSNRAWLRPTRQDFELAAGSGSVELRIETTGLAAGLHDVAEIVLDSNGGRVVVRVELTLDAASDDASRAWDRAGVVALFVVPLALLYGGSYWISRSGSEGAEAFAACLLPGLGNFVGLLACEAIASIARGRPRGTNLGLAAGLTMVVGPPIWWILAMLLSSAGVMPDSGPIPGAFIFFVQPVVNSAVLRVLRERESP